MITKIILKCLKKTFATFAVKKIHCIISRTSRYTPLRCVTRSDERYQLCQKKGLKHSSVRVAFS